MTSTLLISHTPLHSQGNKQNSSDYRPVSLTFIVSKLLKQMINSNIVQHLEAYHLLSDHQYGFCCSRLCETLLITLLHDLCHCYDRNRLKHSILCHTNSFNANWNGMAFGKRWKTGSPHVWIVGHRVLFLMVCTLLNALHMPCWVFLRAWSFKLF